MALIRKRKDRKVKESLENSAKGRRQKMSGEKKGEGKAGRGKGEGGECKKKRA